MASRLLIPFGSKPPVSVAAVQGKGLLGQAASLTFCRLLYNTAGFTGDTVHTAVEFARSPYTATNSCLLKGLLADVISFRGNSVFGGSFMTECMTCRFPPPMLTSIIWGPVSGMYPFVVTSSFIAAQSDAYLSAVMAVSSKTV